jgi:hypothetical protein
MASSIVASSGRVCSAWIARCLMVSLGICRFYFCLFDRRIGASHLHSGPSPGAGVGRPGFLGIIAQPCIGELPRSGFWRCDETVPDHTRRGPR